MGTDFEAKYALTRAGYKKQILDGIDALEAHHPFGAVTLACCAIDLLSHVLYQPSPSETGESFRETVEKKLPGYGPYADSILELRNGMVHTFRTGNRYLPAHLSAELSASEGPKKCEDHILVSVPHLLEAVRRMFREFFEDAQPAEKSRFVDCAFIHVRVLPDRVLAAFSNDYGVGTETPLASSTADPFPTDTFYAD
jgi:hypothetical protein